MSSSVFERTRALHSDVEEMREEILDTINAHTTSSKDRILVDHRLKQMVDDITECQKKLVELYEDKDGVRQAELAAMAPGDTLWTTFYETLSSIRQYHARFPNAGQLGTTTKGKQQTHDDETMDDIQEDTVGGTVGKIHFTAEESFGARVDMNSLFERYINLPQFSRTTDYITFLATFHQFEKIPREKKIKAQREQYRQWLSSVRNYLIDFHQRIRPLVDTEEMRAMIQEDFQQRWQDKQIPGWFDSAAAPAEEGAAAAGASTAATPARSDAPTATPAAATPDAANPLFCTACSKLFAKQTVFDAHLPGKKHKKNLEILAALGGGGGGATNGTASTEEKKDSTNNDTSSSVAKLAEECRTLALLEDEIHQFALLLQEQIHATRDHLIKKSTRTYQEISAELAAQAEEIAKAKQALKDGALLVDQAEEEEEEDENAPIYNPLNLPLGFDGKPIPFWLYKLHGLNLKFDCEICGGFTYWGPRNFERHFTEWRHAYGMRALGIPNTKHFHHITSMEKALALFEKLKKEGQGAGWRADEEEEFEDSEGNVFNKRAYLELQRQGLL